MTELPVSVVFYHVEEYNTVCEARLMWKESYFTKLNLDSNNAVGSVLGKSKVIFWPVRVMVPLKSWPGIDSGW